MPAWIGVEVYFVGWLRMTELYDLTTDQGWRMLCLERQRAIQENRTLHVEIAKSKHITDKQVSSLNLWCRQVAQTLSEAGLDMKSVIRCEIQPTEHMVKENIYKPLLASMTGKSSTMDQTTTEPSAVAAVIIRELSSRLGVTLPPWPDRFNRGQ